MVQVYNYPDHEMCKHQNARLRQEISAFQEKIKALEDALRKIADHEGDVRERHSVLVKIAKEALGGDGV